MHPESSKNPYEPPAAAVTPPPIPGSPPPQVVETEADPAGIVPAVGKATKPHVALTILLWLFWVPLFLSYPLDAMILAFQKLPETAPDPNLVGVFGFISFLQLTLAVFFRWLFFRFLISPQRLAPDSGGAVALGVFGALVIFSLIRCVETYGFILGLQSHSWPAYLGFAVPSLLCFLFMIPVWLLRFKTQPGAL